jgi:hypothetical protein
MIPSNETTLDDGKFQNIESNFTPYSIRYAPTGTTKKRLDPRENYKKPVTTGCAPSGARLAAASFCGII